MRLAWAAAVVLGAAATAAADTLKVPQQYATIQEAVDAAAEGDTIVVARGTYQENVTVNTANLRLIGKKAVWDGHVGSSSGTCLTLNADGIYVQGFAFRNGSDHIAGSSNGLTVKKCTFTMADDEGVDVSGDGVTVFGCRFAGCDTAVYISGNGALVAKNLVRQMDNDGIEVYGDDARIERNTIQVVEDGEGIYVSGDGAAILRNRVDNCDDGAIEVYGNAAVIQSNRLLGMVDGEGVYVSGDDALVERNATTATEGGVYVSGNGARVLYNRVYISLDDDGIEVYGDDVEIVGNTVTWTVDDADGISVSSSSSTGGGTIEGNRVSGAVQNGFDLSVHNVTIRGNQATGCGSEDEEAFYVSGDNNTLDGNTARDTDNVGFEVNGTGNTVRNCVSLNAFGDGFRVFGTDNRIQSCTATGSGGQGLANYGTDTRVQGSTFRGNRIDIANAGTFQGGLNGNSFDTGGEGTLPEVDVSNN